MSQTLQQFVQQLRQVVSPAEASDSLLLDQFLATRDEPAFAEIVQRHGPMVLAVCQRVLGQWTDAEDAFQATFLVLSRKAHTIQPKEMLGCWLHGVALRTAMKARGLMKKRQSKEYPLADVHAATPASTDSLQHVIDEEIQRLPEIYRLPILLCDVQEKTRKEVAVLLQCPEGTVAGRLARAREMLGKRLLRRGFAPVVLATGWPLQAATSLNSLVQQTIRTCLNSSAPQATIQTLADGAIQTMFWKKIKLFGLLSVLVLGISIGVVWALDDSSQSSPKTPVVAINKEGQVPSRIYSLIFFEKKNIVQRLRDEAKESMVVAIDPETKQWTEIVRRVDSPTPSPDGKWILYRKPDAHWYILPLTEKGEERKIPHGKTTNGFPVWSPDGKELILSSSNVIKERWKCENFRVQVDGSKEETLKLPESDHVIDWSSDGKWFLVFSDRQKPHGFNYKLYIVKSDLSEEHLLDTNQGIFLRGKFSPDGKRIAYLRHLSVNKEKGRSFIHVMDVNGENNQELISTIPTNSDYYLDLAWSPDGKKLLVGQERIVTEKQLFGGTRSFRQDRLWLLDIARKEKTEIQLNDFNSEGQLTSFSSFYWR